MWWHTRRNQNSSFVRKGPVHLNQSEGVSSVDCWQPRCAASAVVMLDTPCSEVVWRVLATHCIRQFPLHFPSLASPYAITFQLESTEVNMCRGSVHVEASRNVMAQRQKPDFVFQAKRTSPFKSAGGCQFSWLLAAEVCASAVVMLDTPFSEVVWRVLATYCIRQFPLHFPSRDSQCAITFQLDSTTKIRRFRTTCVPSSEE